jgi:N-succinyldiaminopimelate aminotransferase
VISSKLAPFGTSVFSEMTRLAIEHRAVNLSQGFPDFSGPPEMIEAVAQAMREGHNQYARSRGHLELVGALAALQARTTGLTYDPETELVVTSGATEAICSTLQGILETGDEVILIEPFYDSYPACLAMAGAIPRYVTLRFPRFELDLEEVAALIGPKTRAIVLNTPHNPTGKVFSDAELGGLAELCVRHGLLAITDEVYEHLTFDGVPHRSLASFPGMRERTVVISSAGKTFSFTGWKIGWTFAPAPLSAAVQAAHQFVTFATSTPMQVALARTLQTLPPAFFAELRREYQQRRDFLAQVLRDVGFEVALPAGTYFVTAGFGSLFEGDDRAFVRHLIERYRVAAIPPSAFYAARPEEGRRYVRFAFCKRDETLREAASRLMALRG